MKVTRISLFNLPIDNSYKDVFVISSRLNHENNLSYKQQYLGLLFERYPFDNIVVYNRVKKYTLFPDKIVINTNKTDYNYCAISSENDITFYFINGFETDNNTITQTVTFRIEFDVWSNYYYYLKSNPHYCLYNQHNMSKLNVIGT